MLITWCFIVVSMVAMMGCERSASITHMDSIKNEGRGGSCDPKTTPPGKVCVPEDCTINSMGEEVCETF